MNADVHDSDPHPVVLPLAPFQVSTYEASIHIGTLRRLTSTCAGSWASHAFWERFGPSHAAMLKMPPYFTLRPPRASSEMADGRYLLTLACPVQFGRQLPGQEGNPSAIKAIRDPYFAAVYAKVRPL